MADDARANVSEVPKSTRDWIAREYEWILNMALLNYDQLPDLDPAMGRETQAIEEASWTQSRPAIVEEVGGSAPFPARPFRPVHEQRGGTISSNDETSDEYLGVLPGRTRCEGLRHHPRDHLHGTQVLFGRDECSFRKAGVIPCGVRNRIAWQVDYRP